MLYNYQRGTIKLLETTKKSEYLRQRRYNHCQTFDFILLYVLLIKKFLNIIFCVSPFKRILIYFYFLHTNISTYKKFLRNKFNNMIIFSLANK